eukprot:m.119925 g.119925  ORF g.119925 m.119925 type:complete len:301 (-) comp13322_c0_seq2:321-1223(-)
MGLCNSRLTRVLPPHHAPPHCRRHPRSERPEFPQDHPPTRPRQQILGQIALNVDRSGAIRDGEADGWATARGGWSGPGKHAVHCRDLRSRHQQVDLGKRHDCPSSLLRPGGAPWQQGDRCRGHGSRQHGGDLRRQRQQLDKGCPPPPPTPLRPRRHSASGRPGDGRRWVQQRCGRGAGRCPPVLSGHWGLVHLRVTRKEAIWTVVGDLAEWPGFRGARGGQHGDSKHRRRGLHPVDAAVEQRDPDTPRRGLLWSGLTHECPTATAVYPHCAACWGAVWLPQHIIHGVHVYSGEHWLVPLP